MLILRPIGVRAVDYYRREPSPGHWLGNGARALGLDGEPAIEALTRILGGNHPDNGERLGHAHPHRRAGWDLIFAAPKSVSLLAAVAPDEDSRLMCRAQREAVAETVAWIEAEVAWARRQGTRVPARGIVAAAFEHVDNANGEPHLHSHVLLANMLEGPDGRWSALDQSNLWLERRTIGAIYDLALRGQVGRHWPKLRWQLHEGMADVAGVPRHAIEAVSIRRHQVLADLRGRVTDDRTAPVRGTTAALPAGSRFPGGDLDGVPSPRRSRYAAARTRVEPAKTDWRARLAQSGFHAADAAAILAPRSRDTTGPEPLPTEPAEAWLTDRGSSWSRSDALRALAATLEQGASPASAVGLAAELSRRSPASGPGRWTTAAARRRDESAERAARVARPTPTVSDAVVDEVLERRPSLSPEARTAVRALVGERGPVTVLPGSAGRDRLVEQAAILEAARASWESAGIRVALDARESDVRRWSALAGLGASMAIADPAPGSALVSGPAGPGAAGLEAPRPGATPGVIVVDRADRRTTAELLELLERAARHRARVVLVEGGTLPARRDPLSAALAALRQRGGPSRPDRSRQPQGPDRPGRADRPLTLEGATETSAGGGPSAFQSGHIVATATTADALATVLGRWAVMPAGGRPMMVGLGPAEAEALNRLARDFRIASGEVDDRQVVIGGRAFAAGDRVLARRPGPAPSASLGTVESVTPAPPTLTVRWDDRAEQAGRVDAWAAQRLVHGYAATAGVAARLSGPLLLLGDPGQTPRLAHRDVTGIVVAPSRERRRDPPDRLVRLAEAAHRELRVGGLEPPGAAGGPVAGLAVIHERLGTELRAALPPDPGADRRRLDEDRVYAAAHPGQPGSPDARDLVRRAAELAESDAALAGFLRTNGERLVRWHELGRLLDERADLVAHAAALDPGSRAQLVMGPVPVAQGERRLWQRAVQETAVHAARWSDAGRGATRPLTRARGEIGGRPVGGRSPAELASLRRRDQAIRALEEGREPRRGRDAGLQR